MSSTNKFALFGHEAAATSQLSAALGIGVSNAIDPQLDCALFVVNAAHGIDSLTIEQWHSFDEFLTPRILIITGFSEGDLDFDDAIVLARRVLDEVVTRYLVLHDEEGLPCALIDLENMQVHNYRDNTIKAADPDLSDVVKEFKEEYSEQVFGSDGFAAGILFPAVPVLLNDPEFNMGIDIVKQYLESLPSFG